MAYNLKPGDTCVVKGNYVAEGQTAFVEGDVVDIVDVHPHPERPGYKYIVFSERIGMHVRLRGYDLEHAECPDCHNLLSAPYEECHACGWKNPEHESAKRRERMESFYRAQARRHLGM
jgi:hypothetical protein